MQNRESIQIGLLLVLIFVAGAATGWMAARSAPAPARVIQAPGIRARLIDQEKVMKELQAQLTLTPQQQSQVQAILGEWSKGVIKTEQTRLVERREMFRKYAVQIRTLLTPEQAATYDKMTQDVETRRERLMKVPSP